MEKAKIYSILRDYSRQISNISNRPSFNWKLFLVILSLFESIIVYKLIETRFGINWKSLLIGFISLILVNWFIIKVLLKEKIKKE
jgi:hypothetical protein